MEYLPLAGREQPFKPGGDLSTGLVHVTMLAAGSHPGSLLSGSSPSSSHPERVM
jgi:hypothetical protein